MSFAANRQEISPRKFGWKENTAHYFPQSAFGLKEHSLWCLWKQWMGNVSYSCNRICI